MRFKMELDVDGAAKMLSNMAQLTADGSKNWENFEALAKGIIVSAMDAAREFGKKESENKQ